GSAFLIRARSLARVLPRQSPSSSILASISCDGDSSCAGLLVMSGRYRAACEPGGATLCGTLCAVDLIERLLSIDVSALSDADKTLPVVEHLVRAMIADVRMAGPAFTVVAEDDHLPVMSALAEAAPGDVLVIASNGGSRA